MLTFNRFKVKPISGAMGAEVFDIDFTKSIKIIPFRFITDCLFFCSVFEYLIFESDIEGLEILAVPGNHDNYIDCEKSRKSLYEFIEWLTNHIYPGPGHATQGARACSA